MTSFVDADEDLDFGFDMEELTLKLLESVCDMENCPYEACINVTVARSDEVREYNREYRGIDAATDVLSFPNIDIKNGDFEAARINEADSFDPESGELVLGDIVINADRVYSQAEDYGHSVLREFAFLTTHSLFHLMGYDHMTDGDAAVMEEKQESVLNLLGITREDV